MTILCWTELPGPCLQVVASHLTSAADAATGRLVCKSWSKGVSLPRLSFSLAQAITKAVDHVPPHQQVPDRLQAVVASVQQSCSTARGARECCISVSMEALHSLAEAASSNSQPQGAAKALVTQLTQLLSVIPQLQSLQHINLKSSSIRHGSCPIGNASAELLLSSILQPLLLQHLQHQLSSLTLNLHCWPAPQDLSCLLQQLPGLRCVTLQRCPVAVICSLPAMPSLQQLNITGMLQEPVPAGYSYKQRPLLPALPQLTQLVLRSLPLDLRMQELDGIAAVQRECARMQQQQHKQDEQCNKLQRLLLLGLPPGAAKASAYKQSRSGSSALRAGQWVGSSIVQQCPGLRQLHTDFELGPVLLGLTQLTSLHVAQTAWIQAAARAGE